jgi:hypothetical protein
VWPAGTVSQREVAEQEPWDAAGFDDVFRAAHDDGGDAVGLEMARDQAQALVADGAVGHEEGCVDVVSLAAGKDSAASTSIVWRWLRLVGAPWKRRCELQSS